MCKAFLESKSGSCEKFDISHPLLCKQHFGVTYPKISNDKSVTIATKDVLTKTSMPFFA